MVKAKESPAASLLWTSHCFAPPDSGYVEVGALIEFQSAVKVQFEIAPRDYFKESEGFEEGDMDWLVTLYSPLTITTGPFGPVTFWVVNTDGRLLFDHCSAVVLAGGIRVKGRICIDRLKHDPDSSDLHEVSYCRHIIEVHEFEPWPR